ncbi:MAG: hypothetical protein RSA22_04210 [Acinetobacter sp.]
MIQERTTSLRILQTTKKKTLSPAIYLLIGFFSGVLVTGLLFLIFFKGQSSQNIEPTQMVEQDAALPADTKSNIKIAEDIKPVRHETPETEEDTNIAQPESNDLNKFFQRTKAEPTHAGQHTSPFANEPNAQAAHVTAPVKSVHPKKEVVAVNTTKESKSTTQPVKAIPVKEPEAETPDATVQIKVTQKPLAVNEAQ